MSVFCLRRSKHPPATRGHTSWYDGLYVLCRGRGTFLRPPYGSLVVISLYIVEHVLFAATSVGCQSNKRPYTYVIGVHVE